MNPERMNLSIIRNNLKHSDFRNVILKVSEKLCTSFIYFGEEVTLEYYFFEVIR